MYPARSPSLSLCSGLGAGPVWTGPAPLTLALTLTNSSTDPVGGTASVPGDGHGRHRSDAGQTGACVFTGYRAHLRVVDRRAFLSVVAIVG